MSYEKFVDLSAYNGSVNFKQLREACSFVILRSTVKSGAIDRRAMYNYREARMYNFNVDWYKFMYATSSIGAVEEIGATVNELNRYGLWDGSATMWLDVEAWEKRNPHTTLQLNQILKPAIEDLRKKGIDCGIYCNLDYLKRLPDWCREEKIWLARYINPDKYNYDYRNKATCAKFPRITAWQYTSEGKMPGINGSVDISFLLD